MTAWIFSPVDKNLCEFLTRDFLSQTNVFCKISSGMVANILFSPKLAFGSLGFILGGPWAPWPQSYMDWNTGFHVLLVAEQQG